MSVNRGLFSSNRDDWETPQELFETLDAEFHFTLDPCCTAETAKCAKFYTEQDDGLAQSWQGERVFVNPPYGRQIGKWVAKAHTESGCDRAGETVIVLLLPSRTDTAWWHSGVMLHADEIRFIVGRLRFGNQKNAAPFPSAIVVFAGRRCHAWPDEVRLRVYSVGSEGERLPGYP